MNTSIQKQIRIAGLLYLFIIIAGIFNEMFVLDTLIVPGDSNTTVNNITSSETLFRIGISGTIVMLAFAIIIAVVLYNVFKKVDILAARLALFFNLVSISVELTIKLSLLSVLYLSSGSDYLKTFEPEQLNTLSYLAIRLHAQGYNISLIFFGMNCFFWGYLIYKSELFPKAIGILLIVCAACYIINSFTWFLAPAFAGNLFPAILIPCFIAELVFCLWLIFKGVQIQKWQELNAG